MALPMIRFKYLYLVPACLFLCLGGISSAVWAEIPDKVHVLSAPLSLSQLGNIEKENTSVKTDNEDDGLSFDIRKGALREAAISYGARGGLAMRTFEIRAQLEKRARYLDKVYNFRELLIPAPSGFMIEPPIVSEALKSMIIDDAGQQAAISDRIYNITRNAKIVSTARSWHSYLEREWSEIDPPPDILRPQNDEERAYWIEQVRKGWDEGHKQADEIFEEDLNRLMSDFQGMVRYRMLLAQGMISKPYALQIDRGVTGDGTIMRVGDRAVQITGVPKLLTGSDKWQPANR